MPPQYLELQALIRSTDLFSPEKKEELLGKLPDFMPITVERIIKEVKHYDTESKKLKPNDSKDIAKQAQLYKEQFHKVMAHIRAEEKKEWLEHGQKELKAVEHEIEQL